MVWFAMVSPFTDSLITVLLLTMFGEDSRQYNSVGLDGNTDEAPVVPVNDELRFKTVAALVLWL